MSSAGAAGSVPVLAARCDNVQQLVALLAPLVLDKKCLVRAFCIRSPP